jgi:predicted dehydrogenase
MSDSQPVLRLGVIGTGLAVEKLHWPALTRLQDRFRIVAFANHTRPKAEHFAHYAGLPMTEYSSDYQNLLKRDDIDAVLISLPIPLNYPVTRDALQAGKHVVCEKPSGKDLPESRQFLDLARQYSDLTILIAENWFYRDDIRLAKHLLDSGVIGRQHLVTWRNISQLVPREGEFSSTPWRHDPGYIGGAHLDAGVHHIAELRALCGDVTQVYGAAQDANSTHGGPSDLALTLSMSSGAVGSYAASYPELAVPRERNDLRIYGTEGVLSATWQEIRIERPGVPAEIYRPTSGDRGYYNEFLNFHEAICHGAPLLGTVEQSWRNMQVIAGGIESASTGLPVRIDPYPDHLRADALPLWKPLGADPFFDNPANLTPVSE